MPFDNWPSLLLFEAIQGDCPAARPEGHDSNDEGEKKKRHHHLGNSEDWGVLGDEPARNDTRCEHQYADGPADQVCLPERERCLMSVCLSRLAVERVDHYGTDLTACLDRDQSVSGYVEVIIRQAAGATECRAPKRQAAPS